MRSSAGSASGYLEHVVAIEEVSSRQCLGGA